MIEPIREGLATARLTAERLWRRINWRSPWLLGFWLSLVYWLGLFGWMTVDIDFKAFRYAGF